MRRRPRSGRWPRWLALACVVVASELSPLVPAHADVVDVAEELGLPQRARSWDVALGRIDSDAVPDVAISYHDSVVFYRNTLPGLLPVFSVVGEDPHACTIADVDLDGLGDVYCTRGANQGRIEKTNRLWMQTAPGRFEDRAAEYGVQDPLGRGRHTTFLDLDHDPFPDLLVSNGHPRADGRPTPNRTFVDQSGSTFEEVDLGVTKEVGGRCLQAVDQDRDGWEDLLICGQRVHLYRREPRGFRDVSGVLGIAIRDVTAALLADLNGNRRLDLIVVRPRRLVVLPGRRGGGFGPPVVSRHLRQGLWVTVGNVDGRRRPDLYVVQSCLDGSDVRDVLLVSTRRDWVYRRIDVPRADAGCGDVAAAVDLNGDGIEEVIVLNGDGKVEGAAQVMSTAWDQ